MIFGRTDLRMGSSQAKFDARADCEVHLAIDPRKRRGKLIFRSENFTKKIDKFFVRSGIDRNAFWQSFVLWFGSKNYENMI